MKEGALDYSPQEIAQTKGGIDVVEGEAAKVMFDKLIKEDVNDKALKWKKVTEITLKKTKNTLQGIVYSRPMEGSKINMTRGEYTLKNLRIEAFREFMKNIEQETMKNKQIKEFKVIERFEDGTPKIMYSRAKMPMMTDRDNLIELGKTQLPDGSYLFTNKSIDRDDYPPRKGCIRMDFFKCTMLKQVGPDLSLIEFQYFDMKGYFPARLINMMMSAAVMTGLKSFYENMLKTQAEMISKGLIN
mmetsp:Transcript_11011/g.16702  ORF Transcript_11011/g.16702 Transcript_11011/m.16702 type:complete len:244 (-) Transcript_11011:15-746(-)